MLDVQSSSFLIKENRICPVAKHHAEPNMNVLLKSNLPLTLTSDSEDIL